MSGIEKLFGGIRRFVLFLLTILVTWAVLSGTTIPDDVFTLIGMVYAFYFGADFVSKQASKSDEVKKQQEQVERQRRTVNDAILRLEKKTAEAVQRVETKCKPRRGSA